MLYDAVAADEEGSPEALLAAYFEELASVVADLGVDTVVGGTGLDRETVEAIQSGARPELTLEEASEVLALSDGAPDADSIAWESRDHVLMGMTTAVVDVDTIAREIDTELDGKEIQQAVEGRLPTTLEQFAAIQAYVDARR
ncbi:MULTISPECIES: DUF5791 family protein [Halolamina]|uniref:Uncharacterized protein n=1 Tax=Halolamina pelagica TaxID=699431 RepID=A0A1I5R1D6_9EURY|nr:MULTISPECIES: DUF5791 family protein [Halolamina]NHX35641.1 hypothetical protein [Halolamina sp. R1-12]SFP52322.1 hypothetical protein SAMN05216277_104192 [Halolamina pelagica]